VADAVGPADISHGFASLTAPDCFGDLECRQFGFPPEANTTSHRTCSTFAGPGQYYRPLELGEALGRFVFLGRFGTEFAEGRKHRLVAV
jgi:hypothetical protein